MLIELRKYLGGLPSLGALMDQKVQASGINLNNFEELKTTRETARTAVLDELRETRQLHTLIQFPDIQETCAACQQPMKGGYVELNNAATGKAILIPTVVWHHFVEHGVANYVETVTNLGGSKIADRPLPFDLRAVIQVMHPSIPTEVVTELQQLQTAQRQG